MKMSPKGSGIVAALICIGAGLYLLSAESPPVAGIGGTSWFEVLAHGIGIYFIGKGIYIGTSSWTQAEANERLDKLIELEALRHSRETNV
jgi:hypothetical protein